MNASSPAQTYLEKLHRKLQGSNQGALADYIPELALANSDSFGIAIVTVDGQIYQVGDTGELFTIQSASKPICFGLALEDRGIEEVQKYVGVEPSGEAFNSLSLDPQSGRPKNPMINAGAIASTSLINGKDSEEQLQRLIETFKRFMGRRPVVDEAVYLSESKTGHRNRALNSLMRSFDIVPDDNDQALDVYFKQCSLSVNCLDMANIAACLANDGVNPITSVQALQSKYVSKVLSVMSSCGMYDFSGGWIYEVGMPAKSGVSGGIMAVLPGQFGIAVYSPLLDDKGNSVKGIKVCRQISEDFNLHLFHTSHSTTSTVIRHKVDGTILQSCRARSAEEKVILSEHAKDIKIYSLQGELMFGATDALTQHITHEKELTRCTILDLNHVLNIDQASMKLMQELVKTLLTEGKIILFTHTQNKYVFRKVIKQFIPASCDVPVCEFADYDRALEWCEDYILWQESEAGVNLATESKALAEQELCAGLNVEQIQSLESLCKPQSLLQSGQLFSRGELAESLFFVLEGELNVQLGNGRGQTQRLATVRAGMAVGELALVTGDERTANVLAKSPVRLLELNFKQIPDDIKTIFLKNIAQQLAAKLAEQNRELQYFLND